MASPLGFGGSPAHSESFSSPNPHPITPPVRRKPLPHNGDPVTSGPDHPSSPISLEGDKPTSIPTAPVSRPLSPLSVDGDSNIAVQKNPNRYATSNNPGFSSPRSFCRPSFFSPAPYQSSMTWPIHAIPLLQSLED